MVSILYHSGKISQFKRLLREAVRKLQLHAIWTKKDAIDHEEQECVSFSLSDEILVRHFYRKVL